MEENHKRKKKRRKNVENLKHWLGIEKSVFNGRFCIDWRKTM